MQQAGGTWLEEFLGTYTGCILLYYLTAAGLGKSKGQKLVAGVVLTRLEVFQQRRIPRTAH